MTWFLALLLTVLASPSEHAIAGLRATAPDYLTTHSASGHLVAARAAGAAHGVSASVLLAIAWHESRYVTSEVTPEPGGRVSCGVMTPTPQRRCRPWELTLLGGYDAGARHLKVWLDLCAGRMRCALLAYAGGFGLVRACAAGPWIVDGRDLCEVADQVLERALWIRRAL